MGRSWDKPQLPPIYGTVASVVSGTASHLVSEVNPSARRSEVVLWNVLAPKHYAICSRGVWLLAQETSIFGGLDERCR